MLGVYGKQEEEVVRAYPRDNRDGEANHQGWEESPPLSRDAHKQIPKEQRTIQ